MPSFPRSAWRTSTSWLSRTLVSEKMLRMSSSTISTLAPASSGDAGRRAGGAFALRRCGFLARACSRSAVKTRDELVALGRLLGHPERAHADRRLACGRRPR